MEPAIGDMAVHTWATSSGSSSSSAPIARARSQAWRRASPTRIPRSCRATAGISRLLPQQRHRRRRRGVAMYVYFDRWSCSIRWPASAPTSSASDGCRRCSGRACSAPTALSEPQAPLGRGRAVRPRAARRRRLRAHRHEGLGHPRRRRPTSTRCLPAPGTTAPRRLLLPGAGATTPGLTADAPGAQDGPDRLDRPPAPARPARVPADGDRRRGRRASGSPCPHSTPAGSASPRARSASPRRRWTRRCLGEGARPSSASRSSSPGAGVPARRHGRGGRVRPGDLPGRRPAPRPGAVPPQASMAKLVATDTRCG